MTRIAEGNPVCKAALQFKATTARRGKHPDQDVASFQTLFQKAECSFHYSCSSCPLQIRPARPSGFRVWLEVTMSFTENLLKFPEEREH